MKFLSIHNRVIICQVIQKNDKMQSTPLDFVQIWHDVGPGDADFKKTFFKKADNCGQNYEQLKITIFVVVL